MSFVSICPTTYDIRDPLIVIPGPGSDLRSCSRRVSRTRTLDVGAAIYDGGFTDADRTIRVVVNDATSAQVDRAYELVSENTSVTVAQPDGCYSGVIQNQNYINGTLTLIILVSARLDT